MKTQSYNNNSTLTTKSPISTTIYITTISTTRKIYTTIYNNKDIRKADEAAQALVHMSPVVRVSSRKNPEHFQVMAELSLRNSDITKFPRELIKTKQVQKEEKNMKVYYRNKGYAIFEANRVYGSLHPSLEYLLPKGKYTFYLDYGVYKFHGIAY